PARRASPTGMYCRWEWGTSAFLNCIQFSLLLSSLHHRRTPSADTTPSLARRCRPCSCTRSRAIRGRIWWLTRFLSLCIIIPVDLLPTLGAQHRLRRLQRQHDSRVRRHSGVRHGELTLFCLATALFFGKIPLHGPLSAQKRPRS